MVVLSTTVIVILIVVGVVIVLVLLISLICCLCKQCERCARWSRRTAIKRNDVDKERHITETRREFDQVREEHNAARDAIRVKYNLNGGNSNATVVP